MGLIWELGIPEFRDLERPVGTLSIWHVSQSVHTAI